jgi:RES domain-containing protein
LRVYRLGQYRHQDTHFSGQGGLYVASRWMPRGYRIVYTSGTLALAQLEYLVHYKQRSWIPATVVAHADIPDGLEIERVDPETLPPNWAVIDPPPAEISGIGRRWIEMKRSAVLAVPSALSPVDWNYLLNPSHPDFESIVQSKPQPFVFDTRLTKGE